MKYVNIETLEIKEIQQLREEFTQTSIPDYADLTNLGYGLINSTNPPFVPEFYRLEQEPPVLVDGVWWEQWSVVPLSAIDRNNYILDIIDRKEREKIMPRVLREATILQLETWAISKGYSLDQFRLANKGYRGLKEFDEEIQQLRSHLIP